MARVNKDRFLKRLGKVYDAWNNQNEEGMSQVSSMMFVAGNTDDDDEAYTKTNALQTWLFGAQLADTVLLLTKSHVYFLGGVKKAQFVEGVASSIAAGSVPPISILQRDKADKDKANMEKLGKYISDAGGAIGHFAKDKPKTDFSIQVVSAIKALNPTPEFKDVSGSFAKVFAVKFPDEIEILKKSCTASVNAWRLTKTRIINAVDREKKVKHSKFADELEAEMTTVQCQGDLSKSTESCYTPIVQSGESKYVLKFSATSPETPLNYGCIVASLGCRFRSYCSNVGRTMMIEPADDLEVNYESMMAMEAAIIEAMRPGAVLADVYQKGIDFLKERAPHLVDKIAPGPFGFSTGLEFREGGLIIHPKCKATLQANMAFVVAVGANGLRNNSPREQASRNAAIFISDTVLVSEEGPAVNLTAAAKNRVKSFVIRLKEPGEDVKPAVSAILDTSRRQRNVILEDQTRHKQTNEEKRKKKQQEIGERLNEEARARLAGTTSDGSVSVSKKSNIAYKNRERIPDEADIKKLMIYVDRRNDSIIVPIYGIPVPFHISMVKNCSHTVEGDVVLLRINFAHPGSQIGRDNQNFQNPLATFIKELTFRSNNVKEPGELQPASDNLLTAMRLIKDLQKKFRTQEAEEREREGAVKQDKLRLNPATSKMAPKLKDLFVRPNVVAKRITGTLEAHVNGFRYHSIRGDDIDVLYNNIKHAFFQPCDNEMIVVLHFHLKHPVLWGKKKYTDIQFFTEVGEITTDLGKFHHMQDRDDMHNEQQEREMRKKLNGAFQTFCDKVARLTNDAIEFDQPFSQLSFFGVPYRSSCVLKPTSSCLVNLTEWPPLVVTLDEVELVSFERVSFQIRNFDMVFVFKDYSRKVQTINSIPTSSLDSIKEWLNSCEIRYFEGIQSLNWNNIMKTIVRDPEAFFDDGGWNFLSNNSDAEEGSDDESSEEGYSPSESDGSGEESSEADGSDDDVSDGSDDSGSEDELDSDESSGKDWSDLEEEAARADRDKERGEVDRDRGHGHKSSSSHKRSHFGGGSKSSGPPPKRRK
uniref:FACT complex subunit n=1 Tax=Panagrellus redivivus TaxID=6233 RepID=A0A7E4VLK0_PANRE